MKALITGATGCVGGNLAELLISKNHTVRALVRPGSDAGFLSSMNVELCTGSLEDAASLAAAVKGVDVVFHCAALVSDWASLSEMREVNVGGLSRLLNAAHAEGVGRFVYMSSMVVLGMQPQKNLDETAPHVDTGDNYNITKIEAEKIVRSFSRETSLPVTVVRAPYVYGPRDRQLLPRILKYLESGKYAYIGGGNNPLTLVYAKNLAHGLLLAATSPGAGGKIYNITDGVSITRREFVDRVADEMGLRRPTKNIPYPAALIICRICELIAGLFRLKTTPILNRFRLKFMHTYLTFDITKARRELGYKPPYDFDRAIHETVEWFKSQT
jgi:nucleoside-diphosphate-sugar epimerase